jgi:hypothetical protein
MKINTPTSDTGVYTPQSTLHLRSEPKSHISLFKNNLLETNRNVRQDAFSCNITMSYYTIRPLLPAKLRRIFLVPSTTGHPHLVSLCMCRRGAALVFSYPLPDIQSALPGLD